MAGDNGLISRLEDWISEKLAAIKDGEGEPVFKTSEPWNYQIESDKAGKDSFRKIAPFALVKYAPGFITREGDYDLCQHRRFGVIIGQASKFNGEARRGSDTLLGTSALREYVIAALDETSPVDDLGYEDLQVDEFEFVDEIEFTDASKAHAIFLFFRIKQTS